jgi:hypothetical protein
MEADRWCFAPEGINEFSRVLDEKLIALGVEQHSESKIGMRGALAGITFHA